MNPQRIHLQRIHLALDPRAVLHLRLLAEEEQLSLVDLLREVLVQHLIADLRRRRSQEGADSVSGESYAYARQQERAEELAALRTWARMSPEARRKAAESGILQPPPPAVEQEQLAGDGLAADALAAQEDGEGEADDGQGSESPIF